MWLLEEKKSGIQATPRTPMIKQDSRNKCCGSVFQLLGNLVKVQWHQEKLRHEKVFLARKFCDNIKV